MLQKKMIDKKKKISKIKLAQFLFELINFLDKVEQLNISKKKKKNYKYFLF